MYIDIFLVILLIWAIFSGWRNGILKEIVSAIGFFSGILLATLFYIMWGNGLLAVKGSASNIFLGIVAFFILWIILPVALSFAAGQLTRFLDEFPLGIVNRLLGTVFSVAKFAIFASCALSMMDYLGILDTEKTRNSHLYEPVAKLLPTIEKVPDDFDNEPRHAPAKPDTIWIPTRYNRNHFPPVKR